MTDRILCVVFVGFSFLTTYVEGSLRLIGGDDQYEGRIEIYNNGEWQSICYDYWNNDNTFVACRQLGLKGGLRRRVVSSEVSGNTFWSVEKDCNGNESRLKACDSKEVDTSRCTQEGRDEVYVTCKPQKDGVLRLQDGPIQNEGRLEIYHDGEWGTICDDEWEDYPQNAQVACRQLGYESGFFRQALSSERSSSSVPFWMDNVNCLGVETFIQDCPFNGWGDEDCSSIEEIYLECDEHEDNLTRLVGGPNLYEGRLEIYHDGQWGSVCIQQWDTFVLNAHVACRQLGFTGGSFRPVTTAERGEGPFWMDGIECDGDEINLRDCNLKGLESENCSHSANDDVFLQCNPNKGAVQLTGGTNRYNGRVQAFKNGKWYNLCNDNWTNKNLEVTCRQLGTSGKESGNEAPNGYYFTGDFRCGDTEEYLFKCTYSNYRSCSSKAIVVVTCAIPVSPRNGRCAIDLQETCNTTLTCQDVNGFGRCICDNDSFWDEKTNKCEKKVSYNDVCDPIVDDVCTSDLSCELVNGSTSFQNKCVCPEKNDFWDTSNKTCRIKKFYAEVCDPTFEDVCTSDLSCELINGTSLNKCICPEEDDFWDSSYRACRKKMSYNEVCDPNVDDVCTSDLSCKLVNGSTSFLNKCVCPEKNDFWDTSNKTCRKKKFYAEVCDPTFDDVCTSDLSCELINGTSLNKCICPEEDDFWDSSYRACRKRTGLQGIYVADKLNINDAISNCKRNYKGLLATEEHLRQIFSDCTDYADDTWLIGIVYPATEKQLGSCAILYSDGELKTENCTGRRASVCMAKKNNKNDLSCFGFPTVPKKSTSSSAGLIGGVVAVLIILAAVVMFGIGLLYRRRKRECNKDSNMVNNQSYGLSGTVNGSALEPDARLPSNPETRPVDDYDYAMGTDNRDVNDMTTGQINQGYHSSNDTPGYANYTEDRCPPDVKPRGNWMENSSTYMLAGKLDDPSPNTDDLPDEEYNTFSDLSADLPPTDTYDHVHDVPEDGYDQFQLKSSERSNFEQDEETGYMQSSFQG